MKYLRPKRKGVKIKVSPNHDITVMMYYVVQVDDKYDKSGMVDDSIVTIMSITGKGMKYQSNPEMLVRKIYVDKILANDKDFRITDEFNFITIENDG